jgi:hypothetical protein
MAKALDEMSQVELNEALEDLDEEITTDQNQLATLQRRLKNNSRKREQILDFLAQAAMRKGWNRS